MTTTKKPFSPERVKFEHGKHPNSLKNLKPFKPGENGGLNSQGYSLRAELKHALRERRKELIESTIEGAIKREPTSQNIVWDRADGKLTEKHAIIGDIVLRIVDDNEE